MPKVLLVAHWDWVLYNFRLPLAKALRERGHEVAFVCPFGEHVPKLQAVGFRHVHWPVVRRSLNPLREVTAVFHLARIYQAEQPDVVHHFTIKPNLYGAIAARLMGWGMAGNSEERLVNSGRLKRNKWQPVVINTFTGLGFLFSKHPTARIVRPSVLPFMRWAFHLPNVWAIFQDRQDLETLLQLRLVPLERATIFAVTGVDTHRFCPDGQPVLKAHRSTPVVLMACRLLWDKGIGEFVEAARWFRRKGIDIQFWLAGAPDDGNPMCVPESVVHQWHQERLIRWLGHCEDMPSLLRQVDIAVLPSYHEGVPRFLLEAAATGLPLVATDIEGCRLVVRDGENGFIVPVRDAYALAEAIERLALSPTLRQRMGEVSREIAVQEFDERKILAQWLALYERVLMGRQ